MWTGSNDGPVWRTRDAGKTWKNVTPKDLPPGGRVHTIEDSPHRPGSAYVSVYRIYLNDFKPYLYMTNDYGATWTLLTDGTNGIPADHPMHVVREDPKVPGLLYAGTWFGLFVSFDQGKHWQPLQQNLPATPVTDIKVHENDLVIATMGRGFYIMDDVSSLRQVAKARPDAITLFAPSPSYRMSYVPQPAGAAKPEYPPAGARIDYYLPEAVTGEIKLEILDAAGKVARVLGRRRGERWLGPAGAGRDAFTARRRGRRARTEGRDEPLPLGPAFSRPMDARTRRRRPSGPQAAPGTYQVKLTANGVTKTQPLTVKIDPRMIKDGVTPAILVEQTAFNLKVRDAISDANKLADRLRKAMDTGSTANVMPWRRRTR